MNPTEIRECAAFRKQENYPFRFQPQAILDLIGRIFGQTYAERFELRCMDGAAGMDGFRLSDIDQGNIRLEATSGVAAAAGIRWYLHNRCGSYIGPITRRLNIPQTPPGIGKTQEGRSPFLYRYFFNYCTFGYTCAFWDWEQWESFLDWLLLAGYNLILNPLGNERVWENVLQKIGYSPEDARKFLCSPVFYPWQCMLNLTGWGGAAPEHWYDDRVALSKRITQRLNDFGAAVVLPGYSGIVPDDFTLRFPEAEILEQGDWCNFKRPSLVSYKDKWFQRIADLYYEEQAHLLGSGHPYFSVDPFHEGGNSTSVDIAEYGQTCYGAMKKADSRAVWVLQGWTTNPNRKMLKALPVDGVLIANLKSEVNVDGGDDFVHRPWMYGCVNNFGGRRVPRANLNIQYSGPHKAINNEEYSMVGIAMLPEAVEVDECAFDVFADIFFSQEISPVENWQTDYIRTRYGIVSPALEKAWSQLREDVYLSDTSATPRESPFCTRPSLTVSMVTPACGTSAFTYDPAVLVSIIFHMAQELPALIHNEQYCFDLTELMRQLVALTGWGVVKRIQEAFKDKDLQSFTDGEKQLNRLFDYKCKIMADSPIPDLREKLAQARRFGKTPEEQAWFAYQLKLLITSWGNEAASEVLHDYSAREWHGMLEAFYRPRWKAYLHYLRENWNHSCSWQELDLAYPHFQLEQEFCLRDDPCSIPLLPEEKFGYLYGLLSDCAQLLKEQQIVVLLKKQSNAMELT